MDNGDDGIYSAEARWSPPVMEKRVEDDDVAHPGADDEAVGDEDARRAEGHQPDLEALAAGELADIDGAVAATGTSGRRRR